MAQIFSKAVSGRWLDLWYHFAIMFEALFILTTLDSGTRVGRYLIQSLLGQVWQPLGDVKNIRVAPFASAAMVGAWGYFLIQGVRDPLGGINSLWPLFGIANQLLAIIALCLGTTVILKMQLDAMVATERKTRVSSGLDVAAPGTGALRGIGHPAFILVTLVPLLWLLAVTGTAGLEKIFHPDPRIGFLAQAKGLQVKINDDLARMQMPAPMVDSVEFTKQVAAAQVDLSKSRALYFNNVLDAGVAGTFLVLVLTILVISVREWYLLWSRSKVTVLHETPPVWLPAYAVAEGKPLHLAGAAALAITLARELSGESQYDRAREQVCARTATSDAKADAKGDATVYVQVTEERFNGVRRCC